METKRQVIFVRLPPEERALVDEAQERTGMTINEFMRRLIRKELGVPKPASKSRRRKADETAA